MYVSNGVGRHACIELGKLRCAACVALLEPGFSMSQLNTHVGGVMGWTDGMVSWCI